MQLARQELDVELVTADPERARGFYAEVMGFAALPTPTSAPGARHLFRVGGHVLELHAPNPAPERDEGGTNKANGMRLLAFILDDLDAVLTRFDAAGLRHRALPSPTDAPFRVAFAADPDGNALELVGLRVPGGDKLTARMQIGLTVADVERAKHFYGSVLGLAAQPEMVLPKSMGVVGNVRYGYTAGKTTIKFWSMGPALPTHPGEPDLRTGIRLMSGRVRDLDAVRARLREHAAPLVEAAAGHSGEARQTLFTADPDGNWLELTAAD